MTLYQKQMVYYSEKYAKKQKQERENHYLFDYRDDVILIMEKTFGLDLSKK